MSRIPMLTEVFAKSLREDWGSPVSTDDEKETDKALLDTELHLYVVKDPHDPGKHSHYYLLADKEDQESLAIIKKRYNRLNPAPEFMKSLKVRDIKGKGPTDYSASILKAIEAMAAPDYKPGSRVQGYQTDWVGDGWLEIPMQVATAL